MRCRGGITTCAECPDSACDETEGPLALVGPEARETLDALHSGTAQAFTSTRVAVIRITLTAGSHCGESDFLAC